ncbi:MAG: AlpA family phage regulatory protein [Deltaproteobacteria bacterium]|nr:AlpA family phage regulatory protein [Deltaproteobacteria bacterium]
MDDTKKEERIMTADMSGDAFLRVDHVLGTKATAQGKKNKGVFYRPIFPVSKSRWYQGIRQGEYPQPVRLSRKCSAWKSSDIRALVERLGPTEA